MTNATCCTAEDCENRARTPSSPYCEKHYYRLRRTGSLSRSRNWHRRGACKLDGCESGERMDGYCAAHYYRLRRTGSFDLIPRIYTRGEQSPEWAGDEITGPGLHNRLRRTRGRAADRLCVDCGGPALHWSYDHSDPDEKRDPVTGPYSTDLSRYEPRCVPCHKRFDLDFIAQSRRARHDGT